MGSFDEEIFKRLEVQARLLARMPEVERAVATRSPETLQTWLSGFQELPGADSWAVMGEEGQRIAASDPSCRLEDVPGPGASTAEPLRSIRMCGRIPAFVVTVAVRTEQGAGGWLSLGLRLNEAYVDTSFLATGAELVLIDREGPLVTTFQDTSGRRIAPDLSGISREALWDEGVHFDKYELPVPNYRGYYARSRPLSAGATSLSTYLLSVPLFPDQPQVPVRAVLIVPSETMDIGAVYSTVTMALFGLLLLPLLALMVRRLVNGFLRPLSVFREMTARMAAGELEAESPVGRPGELSELTRDFNDMVHKLKEGQRRHAHAEKMAAVGQLAAGVGHEINNPLAYVTANLSFATESLAGLVGPMRSPTLPSLPAEVDQKLGDVSEALAEAQEGAWRVARIVRDLRTFAHSDNTVEKKVLEVRPVVEAALKLASNTLKQRARVVCDFRDTPRVEAHEARLVQVILNLLTNAAQAIPEGHAEENTIHVTTTLGADGSAVVEVSDSGQGMAPEVIKRLFEPFFTTRPVGQGSGLSLSISRNIIEGLGGSLTFRTTEGRGSTFWITLPAAPQDRREEHAATPGPHGAEPVGRVLVVDDEPLVGTSAKRILKPLCEVVVVTSAREVLERVKAGQRFDLLLCDLMMPQMTGMELHEELLRVAPEVAARMLFLTGGAFTPEARQFLREKQWLEKPFDNQTLRAWVAQRLRKPGWPGSRSGDAMHG